MKKYLAIIASTTLFACSVDSEDVNTSGIEAYFVVVGEAENDYLSVYASLEQKNTIHDIELDTKDKLIAHSNGQSKPLHSESDSSLSFIDNTIRHSHYVTTFASNLEDQKVDIRFDREEEESVAASSIIMPKPITLLSYTSSDMNQLFSEMQSIAWLGAPGKALTFKRKIVCTEKTSESHSHSIAVSDSTISETIADSGYLTFNFNDLKDKLDLNNINRTTPCMGYAAILRTHYGELNEGFADGSLKAIQIARFEYKLSL